MSNAIIHRGPDDFGEWNSADGRVALAHRRLSIVDLSSAGRQPMCDGTGRLWITYNGEIYNFQEIKKELEEKGFTFKSHTDTEVILHAYREWSTDCLKRFNGMFAFALYDEDQRKLLFARDRVGKKPLYYSHTPDRVVFASELKALLRDSSVSREIEPHALNHYLTFGYIGNDLSIYKAVKKLPPAHAMTYEVETGKMVIMRYWDIPSQGTYASESPEELQHELEGMLRDAVKLRMISDVPLGAFLSGGVDSSLIVALMAQESDKPVKTFSIGFEDAKYNELPYAKIVADHFSTDHHEIIVKQDAFGILPELVRQFDEPFADSSMIPTYYVSKATRKSVTVALSGDGGDELFGGYSHYLGTLANYHIGKCVPKPLLRSIALASEYLPASFPGKRQLLRLKYDPYGAFIDRASHLYFKDSYRRDVLHPDLFASLQRDYGAPEKDRRRILESTSLDFVNRLGATDFRTYLPDDILVKVDRASMRVSLEVRAPLLDYRLVEFAFGRVPGALKLKGRTSKYLLKQLAHKLLPRELNVNRKWGFAIPIAEWFRGELYEETSRLLLDGVNEWIRPEFIEKLLQEHRAGQDHSGRLYTLLVLSLWAGM